VSLLDPGRTLLDAAKHIGDARHRRAEVRVAYAKERLAPVEWFYRQSFRYVERMGGILSPWGKETPLPESTQTRALRLADEMVRGLAGAGIEAREAAELVNPELVLVLERAEAASVALCQRIGSAPFDISAGPLLDLVRRAQAANRKVADKLRAYQT
jgi:hypothetical protein